MRDLSTSATMSLVITELGTPSTRWERICIDGKHTAVVRFGDGLVVVRAQTGSDLVVPFPKRTRGKQAARYLHNEIVNREALERQRRKVAEYNLRQAEEAARKVREAQEAKAARKKATQAAVDAILAEYDVAWQVSAHADEFGGASLHIDARADLTPEKIRTLIDRAVTDGVLRPLRRPCKATGGGR